MQRAISNLYPIVRVNREKMKEAIEMDHTSSSQWQRSAISSRVSGSTGCLQLEKEIT